MNQDTTFFDLGLNEMTDDARRIEAARIRRLRADRTLAAALSGTFAGTLTELAETRSPVTILTRSGSSLRGIVSALGPDVVVLSPVEAADRQVLIRRIAIEGLLEHGEGHDREVATIDSGPELADLLDEYSHDKDRIAFTMSTGNRFMGSVLRVGIDQMIVRLDGDADALTVPLHAIDQVVLAV